MHSKSYANTLKKDEKALPPTMERGDLKVFPVYRGKRYVNRLVVWAVNIFHPVKLPWFRAAAEDTGAQLSPQVLWDRALVTKTGQRGAERLLSGCGQARPLLRVRRRPAR
jgi:hypothetical protein